MNLKESGGSVSVVVALAAVLMAGCIATPADEPADVGPVADEPSWVLESVAFTGSGRSEGFLCTPVRCNFVVGSQDIELPEGLFRGLNATFTWEPVDPTLDTLEVFLLEVDENLDWTWEESPDTYWVGTSPLSIVSAYEGRENFTYHLHARAIHSDPASAGFRGGFSQTYDASGEVVLGHWTSADADAPAEVANETVWAH